MTGAEIVSKINAHLALKGISKTDFYKACNITSASYSLWNTGKTKPRKNNLVAIAAFLEIPVSELIDEPFTNEKSPMSEDTGLNSEFINLFNRLSPEDQAREVAYLRERVGGQDK